MDAPQNHVCDSCRSGPAHYHWRGRRNKFICWNCCNVMHVGDLDDLARVADEWCANLVDIETRRKPTDERERITPDEYRERILYESRTHTTVST